MLHLDQVRTSDGLTEDIPTRLQSPQVDDQALEPVVMMLVTPLSVSPEMALGE
jgi:hypothetical protein